jgi:hypothetical protein
LRNEKQDKITKDEALSLQKITKQSWSEFWYFPFLSSQHKLQEQNGHTHFVPTRTHGVPGM